MKKKDVNKIKQILKEWRESHQTEYNEFLRTVDAAIRDGDTTLFLRNIFVLKNTKPKGVLGKADELLDTVVFSCNEREKMKSGMVEANTPAGSISLIDIITTLIYTLKNKDKVANSLAETKPVQLWCMYYWLFWEDGANKMETILSRQIDPEQQSWWKRPLAKLAVRTMVKISVRNMMSSKSSWNKTLRSEPDEEMKEEIFSALAVSKSNDHGRSEKDEELENMLVGNREKLIDAIGYFVKNRKKDSHLGYIFHFLQKAECIEKNKYNYTTFHRAIIRQFPDAGISGVDSAQELYGKIISLKNASTRLLNEYNRMNKMMFVKFIEAKQ